MVFSKFLNCQVTSLEAPWIKKLSGTLVVPGLHKLTVILILCVFVVYVFVLQINYFLFDAPTNHVIATGFTLRGAHRTWGTSQHLLAKYRRRPKKS